MSKKTLVISLLLISLFSSHRQVGRDNVVDNAPAIAQIEARQLNRQAKILAAYFAKYDSPLKYHAQDFIDAAEVYDLDWRMLAAISGVESTFGKFIPGGYNGWGWGVYGNQAIYFKSWREGIFTVSKGLRENYINRGYTEPYSMNRIYAASPTWGGKVTYFMNDLDKFARLEAKRAQNYGSLDKVAQFGMPITKIAGTSAILAFK